MNLPFISAPLSASPLSRMLPMSCSVAVGAPVATEEGVPNWLCGPAQEFHLQLVIDGTATDGTFDAACCPIIWALRRQERLGFEHVRILSMLVEE